MFEVTDPHPMWDGGSVEEMRAYLEKRGLDKADPQLAKAAADYLSWDILSGSGEESLRLLSSFKPEDILAAKKLQQKVAGINPKKMPGKGPMEKAAAFAQAEATAQTQRPPSWWPASYKERYAAERQQEIDGLLEGLKHIEDSGLGKFGESVLNPNKEPVENLMNSLNDAQRQAIIGLGILKSIGFQATPRKEYKPDPDGDEVVMEPMEEISQFVDVPFIDWAHPMFLYRLATLDYELPVRYGVVDGAKKVYALAIDRSGSMERPVKQGLVRGMLITLFEMVITGDALLFISTFEKKVDGWQYIDCEQACHDYWMAYTQPQGGETDVENVIVSTQAAIRAGKLGEVDITNDNSPELIIINDGDDAVNPHTHTVAPVSALSVGQMNKELQTVCLRSGGKFHLL